MLITFSLWHQWVGFITLCFSCFLHIFLRKYIQNMQTGCNWAFVFPQTIPSNCKPLSDSSFKTADLQPKTHKKTFHKRGNWSISPFCRLFFYFFLFRSDTVSKNLTSVLLPWVYRQLNLVVHYLRNGSMYQCCHLQLFLMA